MDKYDTFLRAIHEMRVVNVKVLSKDKGLIERICIPFDYGPSRRFKDGLNRYHFYDLNSPEGQHNLSILPEQLLDISITEKTFRPSDYINWETNWFVKRDWGEYS